LLCSAITGGKEKRLDFAPGRPRKRKGRARGLLASQKREKEGEGLPHRSRSEKKKAHPLPCAHPCEEERSKPSTTRRKRKGGKTTDLKKMGCGREKKEKLRSPSISGGKEESHRCRAVWRGKPKNVEEEKKEGPGDLPEKKSPVNLGEGGQPRHYSPSPWGRNLSSLLSETRRRERHQEKRGLSGRS